MDFVIYLGIAVNIIGAILLMIYAVRYFRAFKEAERMPERMKDVRARWLKKRMLGFGLMIGGAVIAVIGCYL